MNSQIQTRYPQFEFVPSIPNHYVNGDAVLTHLTNVFHATIPAGEKFIIRVVSQAAGSDLQLLPEVKSFLGQEEQHAMAHDSFSRLLESKGYHPEKIANAHDRFYNWLESVLPRSVCLAMAAAVEHYTADLGYEVLAHPEIFNGVNPEIAKLLQWHAAEEVEHRSVVFDVLQLKYPSYFLRILGFIFGSTILAASTVFSFFDFAIHDRQLTFRRLISDYRRGLSKIPMARSILRLTFSYLRPGFHPSQKGDIKMAKKFLNQMSLTNI